VVASSDRNQMKKRSIKVPVILGPTAIGKSAMALEIAEKLQWEILSCDSRQVYRKMNIGTAKPSPSQLARVPHWLIDTLDPSESYSAFGFTKDALQIIRSRAASGKTVMICGGTGLYFKCLSEGIVAPVDSDPLVREKLMKEAQNDGVSALYNQLMINDPDSAAKIHANDLQRIVRALTVFYQTGIPFSKIRREKKRAEDLEFKVVKLTCDRQWLYERINNRVIEMFDNGLWDEFLGLIKQGYHEKSPGLQCVGYKELFAHYKGKCSISEAIALIQQNSRRYAKRQNTWFTHQVPGTIFDVSVSCAAIIEHFLSEL